MQAADVSRAVAAATAITTSLGLAVDDAVVLHDSNKLTLRLLPADVVARIALAEEEVAAFEIAIARGIAEHGGPVARLDPRVEPRAYERDRFVVTLWTTYEPVPQHTVPPDDYADALRRLHIALREVDVPAPHVTERVESARRLLADRNGTPALTEPDREFLSGALRSASRTVRANGAEQLLHGEPHPGNLLASAGGLLFIDFETGCRGPVEFDLAHAPEDVAARYPGADPETLRQFRILVLAMITTWRWDRDDRLPDGRRRGEAWLRELRGMVDPDRPGP